MSKQVLDFVPETRNILLMFFFTPRSDAKPNGNTTEAKRNMKEEQQTEKKKPESNQAMLADMEARRAEMMHRNLDYGDMKGVGGIIVWFIIVVLIFCLMYFLS